MKSARSLRLQLAVCASLLCIALASPAFAGEGLSPALAADVNESYRLLATTYYQPVKQQALIDAARAALAGEAAKHHARVDVAPITVDGTESALASLDDAIATTASDAHGDPTEYAYAAIDGMARELGDKYTVFMTPSEFRAFDAALDPKRISGIGVLIAPDSASGDIAVSYVVPETPAERAGLQAGDLITTVDGTPTKGLKTDAASKLLRGEPGSVVHLQVRRASQGLMNVAITRSEIQPPTVVSKMLPNGIGYVYVLAFGKDTPDEFNVALERLRAAKARALVLDLRNDGGGYVDSALDMTSHFVSRRPLLTVEQRGVPPETYRANPGTPYKVPVTVLVNQYTASASEIMAGALQDDGIAALVGTKTFGKGVMQTLTPLADGAAIKITTAHYLTPLHRDINLKGIEPDVVVNEPRGSSFGDIPKDPQLRAALAFLQKKIADAKP